MNSTTGIPGGWYSDGSLIRIGDKYYPYKNDDHTYYNYDTNKVMIYDDEVGWLALASYVSVFDQVPADFISYLSSGNFTLVQG